jgi:hypothetical protein
MSNAVGTVLWKWVVPALGVVALLLGGLWLLQGLDLVHVDPILCAADCEPIVGFSPGWAIAGLVLVVAGCAAIYFPRRRRPASADRR